MLSLLGRLFRWLGLTADKVDEQPTTAAWCIVANVIRERPYGPGGQETRRGTKQFAPGAKVYIVRFFWGMGGEDLTVVGRQRRSHRYITLTMESKWLVNWRVELVYSPHVIDVMKQFPYTYTPLGEKVVDDDFQWMGSPDAKFKAEYIVRSFGGRVEPYTTRPPTDQTSQEQPDKG